MSRGSVVKALYSRIFNLDPLLLSDDSQKAYGKAILQHLLVYRPLTTSDPYPIDLHDPASRAKATRQQRIAPPPTDPNLPKRYDLARLRRQDPSAPDFALLQDLTMITKGEPTRLRADPTFRNHAAQSALLQRQPNRLRIAAVGYRIKISKLEDLAHMAEDLSGHPQRSDAPVPLIWENVLPDTDAQLGRTRADNNGLRHWEEAILRLIAKSLDRGSEIVLLPEFALPPTRSNEAFEGSLKRICAQPSHDFFLFAGTRHEERYNRGLIVSKRGKDVQQYWHYKTASARGLGENIIGPHGTKLPGYQTRIRIANDNAAIVVAVCYDTYDPTNFLNLVLDGIQDDMDYVPKIILVPAFNPASDFVELLRDLSFLAQCTVIYVNGLHGDAHAFVCGVKLSDIVDRWDLLLASIKAKEAEIAKDLQDESDDFRRRKIDDPEFVRDGKVLTWINERRRLQSILQNFRVWLETLQANGNLESLITVEDCVDCNNNRHDPGERLCFRDILYYNIDRALLKILSDFRREFFANDDFLPEPFRRKNMIDAAKNI